VNPGEDVGGTVEGSVFAAAGAKIKEKAPLAPFTSARIGGPADWLAIVDSIGVLIKLVLIAQDQRLPCRILGGGSNVLAADAGVRGLTIINRARFVTMNDEGRVYAESGTGISALARKCLARGLEGLEWAISVPGTVGGAVVGNAGAHGGDVAGSLDRAILLWPDGTVEEWSVEQFAYEYRGSALKGLPFAESPAILAGLFKLQQGDPAILAQRADEFQARRKATQPPGATMGSMFKNPTGDYAGRLIEAAGLKGTQIGGAQISPVHANFFVNLGGATASDVKQLIDVTRARVSEQMGVELELEIELIGDWGTAEVASSSRTS
jgi:UDP-N-acetylmuramate dehydrogenase